VIGDPLFPNHRPASVMPADLIPVLVLLITLWLNAVSP
jgi:hypothetical protein